MAQLERYAELEGSGAAGGLGAALAALGAELLPGASSLLELVGFDERLDSHDLVVTGEGQIDATTAEGKAPGEVALRCAARGIRCVAFGGRVLAEVPGSETVALSGTRERAEADLVELGRRLGRLGL
jgi:glycerate kinase